MKPTPLGEEVIKQWLLTPTVRPFMNITLDEFTLMPNHFHGIIRIGRNEFNRPIGYYIEPNGPGHPICHNPEETQQTQDANTTLSESNSCIGGDDRLLFPPFSKENFKVRPLYKITPNMFGPQSNNLGSIMRGFKSAVTMFARKNKIQFDWQRSYHDIIIRDDRALHAIRRYIRNNVSKWERDRFRKD